MTTYYVSKAGTDANDGLSSGTPVLTIAHATSLLAASDTLLLRRGDRWNEALTVPQNSVTIDAYGSAPTYDASGYCTNAPVLDCGAYVTTWTTYDGALSDSYVTDDFAGSSTADVTTSTLEVGAGGWAMEGGNACVISSDGMARRADTTHVGQYTASGVVISDASYYVTADVKVKSLQNSDAAYLVFKQNPSGLDMQSFLSVSTQISAGGVHSVKIGKQTGGSGADLAVFTTGITFVAGSTYTLRAEINGVIASVYLDGSLIGTADCSGWSYVQQLISGISQVGFKLGGGSAPVGGDAVGMQLVNFDAGPLGGPFVATNTYKATTAKGNVQTLRGVFCGRGKSINSLNNGEYWLTGGKLYIRSDAGTIGDTDVRTGSLTNGVVVNGQTGVNVKNIGIEYSDVAGVLIETSATNCTLTGVMIQNSGGEAGSDTGGVCSNGSNGWTLNGCHIRNTNCDCVYSQGTTGMTITNCRIGPAWGQGGDCIQIDGTGTVTGTITNNYLTMLNSSSPKGGIIVFGNVWTITDNEIHDANWGIDACGSSISVLRNTIVNIINGGIKVDDHSPGSAFTGTVIAHNFVIECTPSIWIRSSGTSTRTSFKVMNNTIVNVSVVPGSGDGASGASQVYITAPYGGLIENNILWNASGSGVSYELDSISGSVTSDYNIIGPESANFIKFTGTQYATLAAYIAGKSQDSHSASSSPAFKNLGGLTAIDYKLTAGSIARDAGTIVAGITDGYLGTAPDIGADEYVPPNFPKTHVDGEVVDADWINDIEQRIYDYINSVL